MQGAAIIFERSGGFAGISNQFLIFSDGRVVNEKGSVQALESSLVHSLKQRIEALPFPSPLRQKTLCSDCFQYRIIISSHAGTKSFVVSEPFLEKSDGITKMAEELRNLLFRIPWNNPAIRR